ncbi:MAG TPA: DUF2800 domain-containing protein [Candidatus Kapabacteria bacterium]|nr:DUF2800 domain-containing protein [Candidatus Kapabacteria bacterium]
MTSLETLNALQTEALKIDRKGHPSASGMERLILCSGSWQLERTVEIHEAPSRSALDGSMLHEVLAGLRPDTGLSERHQFVVRRCHEIVEELERELAFPRDAEGRRVIVEERFWYYDEDHRELYSGQMDYAAVIGSRGLIVDYKTGTGPVTPTAANWQMRASAVLLAHNFELDEVFVAIVQPLAEQDTSVVRYSREDLRRAEVDILVGLRMANAKDAARTPGDRQCRYCRAKALCPEVRGEVLGLVPASVASAGTLPRRQHVTLPTLSGQELAELLPKLELAEKVIREIRRQAKDTLERDPTAIEGYRLREGSERRNVRDVEEAYRRLKDILTPEQFAACCNVQLGRLEEMLRAVTGESMARSREILDELLGDTIDRRPTDRSIDRIDRPDMRGRFED